MSLMQPADRISRKCAKVKTHCLGFQTQTDVTASHEFHRFIHVLLIIICPLYAALPLFTAKIAEPLNFTP
jgi:hypothetical protein